MKTLPARAPTAPQLDDDQAVPEELVGRLYGASASAVADVMAGFSLPQRANLAMFFYRKSHLHRIGLAIAATCDQSSLVQAWGGPLGRALFDQSRQGAAAPIDVTGEPRAKITLASRPAFIWDTAAAAAAVTRH